MSIGVVGAGAMVVLLVGVVVVLVVVLVLVVVVVVVVDAPEMASSSASAIVGVGVGVNASRRSADAVVGATVSGAELCAVPQAAVARTHTKRPARSGDRPDRTVASY